MLIEILNSFVLQLGYMAENGEYLEKVKDPVTPPSPANVLFELTQSRNWLGFHEVRELNQQIQQSGSLEERVKRVWGSFYQSATRPDSAEQLFQNYLELSREMALRVPKDPELGVFQDTDLKLFDDNASSLPLNGIKKSEFQLAYIHYRSMSRKFNYDRVPHALRAETEKRVLRDLRILMSRPLGRQLIEEILNKNAPEPIEIELGPNFALSKITGNKNEYRLCYAFNFRAHYHDIPLTGIETKISPPFINLAHELIHLLHLLNGDDFIHSEAMDPDFQRLYNNWEEHRTIEGLGISENFLRLQFGLPRRRFHGTSEGTQTPEEFFRLAARVGATGDLVRAFPHVGKEVLEEVIGILIQKQDSRSYRALVNAQKEQLRSLNGV